MHNNSKVAFIHGRPSGHPLHAKYAKSVNADFYHEDRLLRWQDIPSSSKIRRYFSWIINAIFFPKRDKYDIILTECIRIPQLIMKKLRLLRHSQRLIALMGDESLYFIHMKKYPRLTRMIMKAFLNSCDAIICTGQFQTDLAKKIVKNKKVVIKNIPNGIRFPDLGKISVPKLSGNKILFLGNIESDWRLWYKGLDVMLNAFDKALVINKEIEFHIVGSVSEKIQNHLIANLQSETQKSIFFKGYSKNLYAEISQYDLLLHTARGEAWGLTIHMAMACGLPCIVSNTTGMKELVQQVNESLITTTDVETIQRKIQWYFSLSKSEKRILSTRSCDIAFSYSEESSTELFREAFYSF